MKDAGRKRRKWIFLPERFNYRLLRLVVTDFKFSTVYILGWDVEPDFSSYCKWEGNAGRSISLIYEIEREIKIKEISICASRKNNFPR